MDLYANDIEQFLRDLGRRSRQLGRIRLVGGAALIHAGIRPGVTQDIDLKVVQGDLDQVIQQISRTRGFYVEFVEPAAFIPLPKGYQYRSRHVGDYGKIVVEYFDFISIALSKIMRSLPRDVEDVRLLVQQGYIEISELDDSAHEVAQRMGGTGNYAHLNGRAFLKRYQAIRPRF